MFKTDHERAVAYAAMQTLKRMLDDDANIKPGFYEDLTGCEITIKLPKGSVVERSEGELGDGIVQKKATQNLYGYALWALMVVKLKKFNQWKLVKGIVEECLREVLAFPTNKVKEYVQAHFPDASEELDELQSTLQIPMRPEETPRTFKEPKFPATITFKK